MNKFTARRHAQPLPKVCTRPRLPEPPSAPIDTLQAYVSWVNISGPPAPARLEFPIPLANISGSAANHYYGLSAHEQIILQLQDVGPLTLPDWLITVTIQHPWGPWSNYGHTPTIPSRKLPFMQPITFQLAFPLAGWATVQLML